MQKQQILDKLHITLSPMQEAVCEAFANDTRPLTVLSPTGTGKTLAYLLPLAIALRPDEGVQAIVVVPGRELAQQSARVLQSMGTGLKGMACYGGRPAMDEHRRMRELGPQVIFGTPGRLNDHIAKANIDVSGVEYIVIDEYDKCLEMGFHDEMEQLMDSLPHSARLILLSATPADEMEGETLINGNFRLLDFLPTDTTEPARVGIFSVSSPQKDKLDTLGRLLLTLGPTSSIVFVNHRESAQRTGQSLADAGFAVSIYHGGLDQKAREAALYRFANGSALVLVSTDLAARGLDIPHVDNIVHYHLPESRDAYIHRVGRTARWDRNGRTFFILGPGEALPDYIDAQITDFDMPAESSGRPALPLMATLYIGKGKNDKISKGDIVGFLCKAGGLKGSDIGRIDVKDRYAYAAVRRNKLAQVLTRAQGEKIKGKRTIVEESKLEQ